MRSDDELIILMDRAASIAGSDYKLAQMLGTGRQSVSNWRHGVVPCPVEVQALMAHIAGLDPVAELARAVVRKHEGTAKGDLLMKALGKASLATGAVLATAGANAQAIFSSIQTTGVVEKIGQWIRHTMSVM
jgi:hypothetical protein